MWGLLQSLKIARLKLYYERRGFLYREAILGQFDSFLHLIIHQVLDFYIKDETQVIHKSRALRSLLHGFVSLNFLGFFQNPVNLEDSFQSMIDDFILSVSRK
jgi:hypothetical protein